MRAPHLVIDSADASVSALKLRRARAELYAEKIGVIRIPLRVYASKPLLTVHEKRETDYLCPRV